MKNKKGNIGVITFIIVIVAITAGVIGYMFAKKTQEPVKQEVIEKKNETVVVKNETETDKKADLETYSSEQYGFTINYPKNYESRLIKSTVVAFGPIGFSAPAPLSINVYIPKPYPSFDGYIDSEKTNLAIRDCNKTTLGGRPAYECLSLGAATFYIVIADYNGQIYELLFNSGDKDTLLESKEALDENQKLMLSTFKFTEKPVVIKGWLEGNFDRWILAETTPQLSGYSGRKFESKTSEASICNIIDAELETIIVPCNDNNTPVKWGYGDRVRVYGIVTGGNIEVSKMEIVSALPINSR